MIDNTNNPNPHGGSSEQAKGMPISFYRSKKQEITNYKICQDRKITDKFPEGRGVRYVARQGWFTHENQNKGGQE